MSVKKAKLTPRQKTSRKINRQRSLRKWWQMSRRVLLVCLACGMVALAAGGWWFSHSGRLEQMTQAASARLWHQTARMGFTVEDMYLEGRHFTPLASVTQALGVRTGDPILALSLSDMRARLKTIPQVKDAEVVRVLPNQLHVHIVERVPVAVWQHGGKLSLVDQDGVAMEYVDPAQYRQLIIVVGEDAPAHTHELLDTLALEPDLYKNVAAAQRIGERRWNIRFKNGVELKLPERNSEEAWQNFARMDRDHHLLDRPIKAVDMRLSDRIFIKSAPEEAKPAHAVGGRET